MMKNYKIILAYDGTNYNGWQKQGNTDNTIQEKMELILGEIAGQPVEVFGSGRTDAGTHAMGQVANFHMEWDKSEEALLNTMNEKLGESISVLSLEEAHPRFHSRLSAKAKIYEYTIWNSKSTPVFNRKYAFWCRNPLDTAKMIEGAKLLLGEHDFKSFCANKRLKKSTVRTIYDIQIRYADEKIIIAYKGDGFLYQMVRIITGTLIEIGEGKKQPTDILSILQAENREIAGFTAPAKGLLLKEVFYNEGQEKI